MKWYQPIECDNTVKNPFVCDYDNLDEFGFNENSFIEGKTINNWTEKIFIQSKKKKNNGTPDDVLQNHLMIPIYSRQLVNSLANRGIGGIQYLPIGVFDCFGQSLEGFSIANFTNYIEAFDFQNSDYDLFREDFPNPAVRGQIARVRKFVLKKRIIQEFDVIRLKEYDQRFFVSEKFVEIFNKNNYTGYSFREIELV